MSTFAYIRVSTVEQNLDRQITKMRELGVEDQRIYSDKQSGKSFDRPGYEKLKKALRAGDLLIIDSLDRLGREYRSVIDEWQDISNHIGADIQVLDNDMFDTRKFKQMGDIGMVMQDMFLNMLSYVADTERKKMLERQKEGIAEAKARGVKFGRSKSSLKPHEIEALSRFDTDPTYSEQSFCSDMGCSRATLYRKMKQYRQEVKM